MQPSQIESARLSGAPRGAGWNEVRDALGTAFRLCARIAFAVFILPLLYLIEPFWRIRIWMMPAARLGHLASGVDMVFRRRQVQGSPKRTTFLNLAISPANRQLLEMWKRHLPIVENVWANRFFSAARPVIYQTRFHVPQARFSDYYELDLGRRTLEFTEAEAARGRAALSEMGIGPDDWFACFHCRDAAFQRVATPVPPGHDSFFRNADIESYLEAARHVADRDGFAIRMGSVVERPLPDTGNARIIDYASTHRSDFMDIYLCAKARFFIGSSSGLFQVAQIFDVPIANANFVPLGLAGFRRADLFIPKLARDRTDGRILTFQEAFDRGLFSVTGFSHDGLDSDSFYLDRQVDLIDNDPDDILDLCKDMIDRLEGKPPPDAAAPLQRAYKDRYMITLRKLRHPELAADIGPRFVLRHQELFS